MRKYIILITISLFFIACQKENSLEDIVLQNSYDVVYGNYLEVTNLEQLSCEVIRFNIKINSENIPPNLTYTHFLIKDTDNNFIKTETEGAILMTVPCNEDTDYRLVLFNETNERQSIPSLFSYRP